MSNARSTHGAHRLLPQHGSVTAWCTRSQQIGLRPRRGVFAGVRRPQRPHRTASPPCAPFELLLERLDKVGIPRQILLAGAPALDCSPLALRTIGSAWRRSGPGKERANAPPAPASHAAPGPPSAPPRRWLSLRRPLRDLPRSPQRAACAAPARPATQGGRRTAQRGAPLALPFRSRCAWLQWSSRLQATLRASLARSTARAPGRCARGGTAPLEALGSPGWP